MSRITAPEGEVTTPYDFRQIGQFLLALGREEAFGGKRRLALFQHRHQRADTRRFEILDHDLIARLAAESGEPPGGDHFHAFLGLHRKPCGNALPDHPVEDRFVILEIEIDMARARP